MCVVPREVLFRNSCESQGNRIFVKITQVDKSLQSVDSRIPDRLSVVGERRAIRQLTNAPLEQLRRRRQRQRSTLRSAGLARWRSVGGTRVSTRRIRTGICEPPYRTAGRDISQRMGNAPWWQAMTGGCRPRRSIPACAARCSHHPASNVIFAWVYCPRETTTVLGSASRMRYFPGARVTRKLPLASQVTRAIAVSGWAPRG